jgi:hypothetical protein
MIKDTLTKDKKAISKVRINWLDSVGITQQLSEALQDNKKAKEPDKLSPSKCSNFSDQILLKERSF